MIVIAELPQPTSLTRPPADLKQDFAVILIDRAPDPAWHFKIMVRRTARLGPDGDTAPSPGDPLQTLALFQREEPIDLFESASEAGSARRVLGGGAPDPSAQKTTASADLEVWGVHLAREIDPADWLDVWLEEQGMTVVSRKPQKTAGGVAGDAVATWDTEANPFAGRFFAMKWGARLFIVGLRAPREHYARFAEEHFLAMASLSPVDTSGGLLAEKVNEFGDPQPVPWKVLVPASWMVQPDSMAPTLSSFRCTAFPLADTDRELLFGKLSFGLAARSLFKTARAAANAFLDAVKENHTTIEQEEFVEEPAPEPFDKAWALVSAAACSRPPLENFPCEVRCRVFRHDQVWFVAGVFGPSRDAGAIAWMQNKRTLDVLTSTLEVKLNGAKAAGAAQRAR
jgi:hypothetical protein